MKSLIVRFVREEAGQDLIEYGLLVGIITAGAVVAIGAIGPRVTTYFETLNSNLEQPRSSSDEGGSPALVYRSVVLIGAQVQRTPQGEVKCGSRRAC